VDLITERFILSILFTLKRSWNLLTKKEKIKLYISITLQFILNALDLLGVLSISLTSYVLINRKSPEIGIFKNNFLSNYNNLASLLVAITILLFTIKGLTAPILFSRIIKNLSKISIQLSLSITRDFFSKSNTFQQKYKSQESIYAISQGVTALIVEVFGNMVLLISELILLVGLAIIMAFSNLILTILNVALFGLGLGILHKIIGKKIFDNQNNRISAVLSTNIILLEIIDAYREIIIYKKLDFFLKEFLSVKTKESNAGARGQVLNILPKYIFESMFYIISGIVLIFLYQFTDPSKAVALFILFIASGTRVLPSVLRIQACLAGIRASQPLGNRTFTLLNDMKLEDNIKIENNTQPKDLDLKDLFVIKSLKFYYSKQSNWKLEIDNLRIERGLKIAIVGPSGSGKSTLVDLLLGILKPNDGEIFFNNSHDPLNNTFLNQIAYVPQQIAILSGTIKENVALGQTLDEINEKQVIESLKRAGLWKFVSSLPSGINEQLNERGSNLSGGQKQRLGFARAIYTKPNILFLDESTSSLDSESEFEISEAIANLESDVSVISIAHRLSTIKNFDLIIYMENGRISEIGTFQELRAKSSSFNLQAKLMEL